MWESGKDQANGTGSGSDYATHNNTYYYPWLLQQLAAYKQANGVNLIDVLSVHCYTDNGSVSPAVNTRELWDPNYQDPNWWADIDLNGKVIEWIPLMQSWIQQYDPGLQTGCTEYTDWDSDYTISGISTQADMLGIFGYYGLDFANTFTDPYPNHGSTLTPSFLAFLIYRNYDGNLSTFGDTSVSTTVANPDNLSAFSALRTSDGALTVMVMNKQSGNTPVTINLPDFANTGTAQVYQVNSASQTSVSPMSVATIANNAITATLPGPSVTLFVIPAESSGTTQAATPTFTPPAGTYTSTQSVTISDGTSNATIYYTTNGTTPSTSSTKYTAPISVSSSETIEAVAVATGYSQSAVGTAAYTIGLPAAATPTLNPPAGTYTSAQSVTISDSTANATIYYTTNGTTPTTSSTKYASPVSVGTSETIEAVAVASGYAQSSVASAAYTINISPPATPSFTISGTAVSFKASSTSGGTSAISVMPSGGFTGSVALSAAITAEPSGATQPPILSFGATSPVSITGSSAGTATLTISTTAASGNALLAPKLRGRWSGGAGAVLACLLLFVMPITRRRGRALLGAMVLLMILTVGLSACGGRISVGGGNASNSSGTTPGTYTVTITGTSGAMSNTGTVIVVVQ